MPLTSNYQLIKDIINSFVPKFTGVLEQNRILQY